LWYHPTISWVTVYINMPTAGGGLDQGQVLEDLIAHGGPFSPLGFSKQCAVSV